MGVDVLFQQNPVKPSSTSTTTIAPSASSTKVVSTASSTQAYQRQFQNIARSMKIFVGAHYEPFFRPGTWTNNWNASNGTPLAGLYNSADSTAVSKHIDWATGHGISAFSLDWYGPQSVNYVDGNVKLFLQNDLINDIRFIIMYDSLRLVRSGGIWNMDDPANQKTIQDDFSYIMQNYFGHPSQLSIDKRKVVFFYASGAWRGDIKNLLDKLRSSAKAQGHEVFFIGDPVQFHNPSPQQIIPFDGITQWVNYSSIDADLDSNVEDAMDTYYPKWASMAKDNGVLFIPSALPGFRRIANPEWPTLPRSIDRLTKQLKLALKYMDPNVRMLFITTFNDWTENTQVEPSVEDNFKYLQALRDTLAGQ